MSTPVKYVHLRPGAELPELGVESRFRAVVIVDAVVANEWRNAVSDWLVRSGCLYMLAWGLDCSSWDDAVDWSVLGKFNYGHIPDDQDVETTWHAKESLDEVFWNAKYNAEHWAVQLGCTVLVHIADRGKEQELLAEYSRA